MKIDEAIFSYNQNNPSEPVSSSPTTHQSSEAISYFVYVDIDPNANTSTTDISQAEKWVSTTLKGYCDTFIHSDLTQEQIKEAHLWTEKKFTETHPNEIIDFSFLIIQIQEDLNDGQGSLFRTSIGCLGPYHVCSIQVGSMMSLFHGNQKTTSPEHNKYAIKTFLFDPTQKLIILPSELAPHLKISFEKNQSTDPFFTQIATNLSSCLTWKRTRSSVRAIEFTTEQKNYLNTSEEDISPPAYALIPRNNKIIGFCLLSIALVSGTFASKYFSSTESDYVTISKEATAPSDPIVMSIQSDKLALQDAVIAKNQVIDDLEVQIDQMQNLISQLEDDLATRINIIQQQETDLKNHQNIISSHTNKVSELETQICLLESQLEKSSKTVDELKNDFVALIETHNNLAESSSQKDTAIADLKTHLNNPDQYWESLLSQNEQTIQRLTADINALRSENIKDRESHYLSESIRKSLGMENSTTTEILNTVAWMNEQCATQRDSILQLTDQLERSQDSNNNLIAEVQRLNQDLKEKDILEEQIAVLESQSKQYTQQIAQVDSDYSELLSNYNELQAVHSQLSTDKLAQDEILAQDKQLTELLNKEIAYRSSLELQLSHAKSEIQQLQSNSLQKPSQSTQQPIAKAYPIQASNPFVKGDYIVQKGDTLTSISLKQYGTTSRWMDLYEANKDQLKDKNRIQVGTKLQLPE